MKTEITEVWVLARFKDDPKRLDVKGAYTTADKAKAAAEKDSEKPLTWKDTTFAGGPAAFVGWAAPVPGWVIDTIYEIDQLEVDPE